MFFGLVQILQGFFLFGHLAGGNSFPKPLSADDERKYLKEYSEGNEDAKNILIEHNLRLVAYVAKKYNNHAKDAEDLISVGTIGLIKAIVTYKPDKGTRLATYAIRCIENAMVNQR
jgi:RNA polymerase sporulation-specific sigma factor